MNSSDDDKDVVVKDIMVMHNEKHINVSQAGREILNSPTIRDFIEYLIDINSTVDFVSINKQYFTLGKVNQLKDLLAYGKPRDVRKQNKGNK